MRASRRARVPRGALYHRATSVWDMDVNLRYPSEMVIPSGDIHLGYGRPSGMSIWDFHLGRGCPKRMSTSQVEVARERKVVLS